MEISILHISINPAYENAVRPLNKSEFESLTNSIKEYGLREKICINSEGVILDGHHRFKACQSLKIGIPPEFFTIKKFNDILEEELYVNEVNLLRRHLTPVQRVQQVLKNKEIYQKLAMLNMAKGGKGVSIDTPIERVNKLLASKADVSPTNFSRIEFGLNNASDVD
jgi:hypothetical protein